ncbi:MAG: hypothetical protein HUU26_05835 [Gemmatimonadaceae bacterium]|nr:hypothetical protein [Gemmatimonadaceae bacterium]
MNRRSLRTNRFGQTLALLAAAGALSVCNGSGGAGGPWDVPEVHRRILLEWFHCTDCQEGELDAVVAKGRVMIPYLSAALLDGPTIAEDSLGRLRAIDAVVRVARYRAKRLGSMAPLAPAESTRAVSRQHDAFRLKYRLRAAQALARIDSVQAARDVAAWCATNPPLLVENPAYLASFKAIGNCQ